MITLDSLIVRKENSFLVKELGDEMVMMNTSTGEYIGLNEVTADIWKLLDKPVSTQEVITSLLKVYDVDQELCELQTLECLNKMLEQGLIQPKEPAP